MRKALLLCAFLLLPWAAQAQEGPRVTLFGGGNYAYQKSTHQNGWSASGAVRVGESWFIRVDGIRDNVAGRTTTVAAGAEYRFSAGKVLSSNEFFDASVHEIGVYGLVGKTRLTPASGESLGELAMIVGAVVDLKISDTAAIRVGDISYRYGSRGINCQEPVALGFCKIRHSWGYQGGVVFRIGR